MANNKNKIKAKKTTIVSKKKAPVKKTLAKKSTTVSEKSNTSKKATKKTATNKKNIKAEKKVEHVSSNIKKSDNTWMIASIILGIILIALAATMGFIYLSNSDDNNTTLINTSTTTNTTPIKTAQGVKLLIIEDPSCTSCDVDLFVTQVKDNLISDLTSTKLDYNSAEGKAIIDTLSLTQVPAYFFSENINQKDEWEEQLKGAFLEKTIDGTKYYMLNPQFIPNKVMVVEPTITDTAITVGDVNAPVTLIQFTDYECPFCGIADGNEALVKQFKTRDATYVAPMPEVYKNYVDTGKVKIVFYNFPIASLHPQSKGAHLATLCANEQGQFEEYSHNLWMDRDTWIESSNREETYKSFAKDLGLDETQFNECLDSKRYESQIDTELALGQSLGVSGTPAFFIGKTFISGAQSYDTFKKIIDEQLTSN